MDKADERWVCSAAKAVFVALELESHLASAIKPPPGQATHTRAQVPMGITSENTLP